MKIIDPSFEILTEIWAPLTEQQFEEEAPLTPYSAGRICSQQTDKNKSDYETEEQFGKRIQAEFKRQCDFAREVIKNQYDGKSRNSILKSIYITIKIICNREVSRELIHLGYMFKIKEKQLGARFVELSRNRRWENVEKASFTVVRPCFTGGQNPMGHIELERSWKNVLYHLEKGYRWLILEGATSEQAKSVAPLCLKTEVTMTCNLRQLEYILGIETLRASLGAYPQMEATMSLLLEAFKKELLEIFKNI